MSDLEKGLRKSKDSYEDKKKWGCGKFLIYAAGFVMLCAIVGVIGSYLVESGFFYS